MQKISIITPSYNHAGFLHRAIDSVRSQRGDFELEHIIVDGGSSDDTVNVLESYGGAIRWISEPDKGQADALNKGMAMATGNVFGWLNSDDLYEPGCLADVAKIFADEPQTQWVYGKVRIVDSAEREIRRCVTWYKNIRMRRWSFRKLLAENWISQMGVFWRRSAAEQISPFRTQLHYCMDYDYWLRLGLRWPGRFVDRYLAAFRVHPASKSTTGFISQFREELEVAREIA
ncbi:MAG: glycosyltransferase, partial [Phycisphaerae bacterium]|nr:glycosyltransferase [Phycisphaerae bacterium]